MNVRISGSQPDWRWGHKDHTLYRSHNLAATNWQTNGLGINLCMVLIGLSHCLLSLWSWGLDWRKIMKLK